MPELSIHSTRFGSLSVAEESVLEFPEGLIGLPHLRRFALFEPSVPNSPFRGMVSLDDPEIGFAIADPHMLFADYEADVSAEYPVLGIEAPEEAALYVILTVPLDNPLRTTANLLAPLLVNKALRIGRQVVLSESRYSTRHPIIAPRQQG